MKQRQRGRLALLLAFTLVCMPTALCAKEAAIPIVSAADTGKNNLDHPADPAALMDVILEDEEADALVLTPKASVTDDARIFNAYDRRQLQEQTEEISKTYNLDVWVYTSKEPGFSDNYARDMLEHLGELEHPDGYIAYGINMADRSYWVDAYGSRAREIFTQSKTDALADDAKGYLKDREYYESAKAVLDGIRTRLEIKTDPMGAFKKPLIYWPYTLCFLGVAFVGAIGCALLWTGVKVKKHKDKKLATQADDYASPLDLQNRNDVFVSSYQTRVKIESSSSGGGGGGGSAGHTGSGGHF